MKKGIIISYVLVFGTIFLVLLSGLLFFILTQLRVANQKIAWQEALNLAEAGLEYYRWCLNNNVSNCSTTKTYYDVEGRAIGSFEIQTESNVSCGSSTFSRIVSTGKSNLNPSFQRKVAAFYTRESVGKYSFVLNSNTWVGSDVLVRGPFHTNGGVRFDGTNLSTVSSAQTEWVCTSSFGCGTSGEGNALGLCPSECEIRGLGGNRRCVCPGVFSTTQNSKSDLFSYPIPQFDFTGITVDLREIKDKAKAQTSGLYFGPSGAFGYRIFINGNSLTVNKVTGVRMINGLCTIVNDKVICERNGCEPECPRCWEGRCIVEEPTVETERSLGTFQIPSNCGVIFFEDNLWIGSENQTSTVSGKITIVAANLTGDSFKPHIWLQGNIVYSSSSEVDGLTLISQNDLVIGLYAPEYMLLNGIFIAQKGFFGRKYYPCNLDSRYCQRRFLKINGSIISFYRVGTKWVNQGGQFISGYENREISIDTNLIYKPSFFTPSLSPEFKLIRWEEL